MKLLPTKPWRPHDLADHHLRLRDFLCLAISGHQTGAASMGVHIRHSGTASMALRDDQGWAVGNCHIDLYLCRRLGAWHLALLA